jgi:hypothetical protein
MTESRKSGRSTRSGIAAGKDLALSSCRDLRRRRFFIGILAVRRPAMEGDRCEDEEEKTEKCQGVHA